jgi:hypothetical protein
MFTTVNSLKDTANPSFWTIRAYFLEAMNASRSLEVSFVAEWLTSLTLYKPFFLSRKLKLLSEALESAS